MITAYHIEHGATRMHSVDVAQAVGSHPHEWSRVPWTDEMKAEHAPKLREKREAERKRREDEIAALAPYDPLGVRVVSPFAGQTGQAPAGFQGAKVPIPPYAADEADKAAQVRNAEAQKQLEIDAMAAQQTAEKAQADLEAAKGKGDDKATAKAQAAFDDAKQRAVDAKAKADAAKK